MYVNQLSQKEQDYIQARLEHFFIKEGLTGEELQQAIQDGMDSKASDLEDIHGNTLYNTCLECEESWNIFEWMGADDLSLDDTDYANLRNHGQLYCVCSDCGGDDQSVLKEETKMNKEKAKAYLLENVEELKEVVRELNSWNGCLEHLDVYENDEEFFDTFFEGRPMEAVRAAHYGDYHYTNDYVRFNGYGNLESLSAYDYDAYLKENINEIVENLFEYRDDIHINMEDWEI